MVIHASMEVELEDKPGQLRKILGVFEEMNANLISAIHTRGRKTSLNVSVELIFTIPNMDALEQMGKILKEQGWRIISLEKISQLTRVTVGIIGHLIHTKSINTLINNVNARGANVFKFFMNMPCSSRESSALLCFEAEDEIVISNAMAEIETVCTQNCLLLIKMVE